MRLYLIRQFLVDKFKSVMQKNNFIKVLKRAVLRLRKSRIKSPLPPLLSVAQLLRDGGLEMPEDARKSLHLPEYDSTMSGPITMVEILEYMNQILQKPKIKKQLDEADLVEKGDFQ